MVCEGLTIGVIGTDSKFGFFLFLLKGFLFFWLCLKLLILVFPCSTGFLAVVFSCSRANSVADLTPLEVIGVTESICLRTLPRSLRVIESFPAAVLGEIFLKV